MEGTKFLSAIVKRKKEKHSRRDVQERRKREEQCMVIHEHVMCKPKMHYGQKPNPNYSTHIL